MQVMTHWQTAYYTPRRLVIECKEPKHSIRAYVSYSNSVTAQKIHDTVKQHPGLSSPQLLKIMGIMNIREYLNTLTDDGMVERKLKPFGRFLHRQAYHYWSAR
jgi:hypothetical protein